MAFRLGCIQFEGAAGEVSRNLDCMAALAARAAGEHGVELALFAEMAPTCYARPETLRAAAEPLDGPMVKYMADVARANRMDLAFGMPELSESSGARYNTMVYLDEEGHVRAAYRKTHLFGSECEWASPGNAAFAFETRFGKAAMWICYDTRFPEAARACALGGARFALVATAWLGPPDEWELAVRSRAMDNGIFVAGADQIGREEGLVCRGLSVIADPHGRVIARAEAGHEAIVVADIDLREVDRFYERVPVLRHRRSDLA